MRWICGLLFLAGCMLGPDYEPIAVSVPKNYENAPDKVSQIEVASFWEQFEDDQLNELVQEALCCSFDLQIALHKIEEFRALYRIESSVLYPQIQNNLVTIRARRSENLGSDIVESTGTAAEIIASDFSGPFVQNFFQFGFDAIWELDFFGRLRRGKEAALYELESIQEETIDIQITLISEVAQGYVDLRATQEQIEAKQEQIKRAQELLDLATARFEAGLTSYLDVAQGKAQLELQKSTLPPLKERKDQTLNALAILLGRAPEEFCLEEGPLPTAQGKLPAALPSDLICRRPDVRQADRIFAAQTARIGQAKAEILPIFSLTGSFGTQSDTLDKWFVWPSRYWTIGPSMIWNLFTGGRLTAQVQVANERQKQALLSYEKAIIGALGDVEDRLIGYFQEQDRLTALSQELRANTLERYLSFDQYSSGLISFDQVLDAEAKLYETQEALIQSQGVQMLQLIGLYKALGGGWECLPTL